MLEDFEHEMLLVRRGARSGATMIVAIDSTALGPALGGCRMHTYDSDLDAIQDALRLARAMTLKAAAAELPLGGGKSVVSLPQGRERPRGERRRALLRDFADALNLLEGRYITAEDVGTTSEDMALLAQWTDHVVGRPAGDGGSGDPGAFTAAGVEAAMRAACDAALGSRSLSGRMVAIVGVGSVGGALARRLARKGARLILADTDASKRELANGLGAAWMDPEAALRMDVDVLAPCALGGVIDEALTDELRCRIICGAANNQLADNALAARLATRGILYAPDFIVNAAGLINASMELTGYDAEEALRRAEHIEVVLARVFAQAAQQGITPLESAIRLAKRRLVSEAPSLQAAA